MGSDDGSLELDLVAGVAVRRYRPRSSPHRRTIVMVNDAAHTAPVWDRWARFLAEAGHDCYTFDWYDHGQSDPLRRDQAVRRGIQHVADQELRSLMADIRRDRHVREPVMMGHGAGALVALLAAADPTLDISRLVLVCPATPMQVQAPPAAVEVTFGSLASPPPLAQARDLFFTSMTPAQAEEVYPLLEAESPRVVWEATRPTVWVQLKNVTCPAMAIAAGQDALVAPESVARLMSLLDAEAPLVIPSVGHTDVLLKDGVWESGVSAVRDWLAAPV